MTATCYRNRTLIFRGRNAGRSTGWATSPCCIRREWQWLCWTVWRNRKWAVPMVGNEQFRESIMNTLTTSLVLFSLLMVPSAAVVAQGVYVTPGDHGPVFSDKPQSGAKEVTLPPLNIVTPPKAPKRAPPAKAGAKSNGTRPNKPDGTKSEEAAVGYRSFSICLLYTSRCV